MSKNLILSPLTFLFCVLLISCTKTQTNSHNSEKGKQGEEVDHPHRDMTENENSDEEAEHIANQEHVDGDHNVDHSKLSRKHRTKKTKKVEFETAESVGHHKKTKNLSVREEMTEEKNGRSTKGAAKLRKPASEDHIHANEKVPINVTPEQAYKYLRHGNTRYLSKSDAKSGNGLLRDDGISQLDRDRMVTVQKPHTIILSCSDSRVPPEVIFDQKLGEIFVVRTAGESLDKSVIASIEYAVDHLGASLLVVMGHESCGAVNASLAYIKDKRECDKNQKAKECDSITGLSPSLESLVQEISPRVQKFVMNNENSTTYAAFSDSLRAESKENAIGVAFKLLKESKIIKKDVEAGNLEIRTAIYSLRSGKVDFFAKVGP